MPLLHLDKQIVALDTSEGYQVNSFTGDSIQPIITFTGDTLISGVPLSLKGKLIQPDQVKSPKIQPIAEPEKLLINQKTSHLPKKIKKIKVDHELIKQIELDNNRLPGIFVNSIGDTIETGIPIEISGKIVPSTNPDIVKAYKPKRKDNFLHDIQYFDIEQGLHSSYIWSIFIDKNDHFWFGSDGGGVCNYNGENFIIYSKKNGLSNDYVLSIVEDKEGNFWFGTSGGGVCKFDGKNFIHYTEYEGFTNNIVWSIIRDSKDNLWFGTLGGGLAKFNGEKFIFYTENEGLSNNDVFTIYEDNKGLLWIGTDGGGVNCYDGKVFKHYTENDGLSYNRVMSIHQDQKGIMWIGTYGGGVNKFDGDSFTHIAKEEGLSDNYIFSILEDSDGTIWISTSGGGINKIKGNEITYYTTSEGLSESVVLSAVIDSSGSIWMGTSGGGVNKLNPSSFVHFTENEGIREDVVRSICEDEDGNLWFGSSSGGLMKYDGISFSYFDESHGLSSNLIRSLLFDNSGKLWITTDGGGVCIYENGKFINYTVENGFSGDNVKAILEDKKGNFWFGTSYNGITKYDGKNFIHYTKNEGISNNNVFAILEDSKGNIWFGTDGGGIIKFDGQNFTHFTEKEGLSSNSVLSIIEDKNGHIWLGTYGAGICVFDHKKFTYIGENQGLTSNIVWSLAEDLEGNIWVSTEKGLNMLQINSSNTIQAFRIHNFNYQDGLKAIDFYTNSVFIDSKNRIWWGSGKGLTMLNLNDFKIADKSPSVHLTYIEINTRFKGWNKKSIDEGNILQINCFGKLAGDLPLLEVPYNKNHLTFYYAGIDLYAQHKIKYSYKVEGLNKEWSTPSNEIKADYRNLPYGKYTFKVRSIGESKEWSNADEKEFVILPPWYHTWWARLSYVILAVLSVILIVKWRTKVYRERNKELTEVNRKLLELDKAKSDFLRLISHEIRTPLNGILGFTALIKKIADSEKLMNYIKVLEQSTNRLADFSLNALLITSLKLNRYVPNLVSLELYPILNKIVKNHNKNINQKKIELDLFLKQDTVINGDVVLVKKCFNIIIENAIKYTPENGYLLINEGEDHNYIIIQIIDSGPGFSTNALENLFSLFANSETHRDKFIGNGLALAKLIMEAHNGIIEVANNEKGAIVNLKFKNTN